MKKQILGVAGAVALALAAGSASAATVGTILDVGSGGNNNGVATVYAGAPSAIGFFGATWYLVGSAATTISVSFLGKEASDTNTFTLTSASGTVTCNTGAAPCNGGFSAAGVAVAPALLVPGLLNFSFSNPTRGSVTNAANPDLKAGEAGVNFFSRISSGACANAATLCSSGTILDLWFDDLGATKAGGLPSDDNHDDMVIRLKIEGGSVEVVPIPAALPLLLSGLAGLGFVARRRKTVVAA